MGRLKLIDKIKSLLKDENINVTKKDNQIVIFKRTSNSYPEDYIDIEKMKKENKYIVYEVHRDEKKIIIQADEEEALIYAVIKFKKIFDDFPTQIRARSIRNDIEEGKEKEAIEKIIMWFDSSVYSIGNEVEGKISLIYSGDCVDVKFCGEYIVKNVSKARGYAVFYNFCEKLKYIYSYYDDMIINENLMINKENAAKLYIM